MGHASATLAVRCSSTATFWAMLRTSSSFSCDAAGSHQRVDTVYSREFLDQFLDWAKPSLNPTIVLLPGLEVVSRSKADRSCRREGQKAALDDLERQDQVRLPAAEVGSCLE